MVLLVTDFANEEKCIDNLRDLDREGCALRLSWRVALRNAWGSASSGAI